MSVAHTTHPPVLTHHTPIISIPISVPDQSLASASHYSGAQVISHPLEAHGRLGPTACEDHINIKLVHQRILNDLHELYCCRPSFEILARSWGHDAVFEHPLCRCRGFKEYAAQWFALSKMMSRAETLDLRIMSSTDVPNRLIFHQVQKYTTRFFNFTKVIDSIVVVQLDKDEKIIHLMDQWNGDELPRRYGAQGFRTANAKIISWLFRPSRMGIEPIVP